MFNFDELNEIKVVDLMPLFVITFYENDLLSQAPHDAD